MLKNFTQSLRIEVAPQALRLLRAPRWGKAAPALLAEQALAAAPDALAAALPGALDALLSGQQARGLAASFVLADELVRMWQVVPPLQAARLADLEAAAALRFHTLYGEAPAAWQMSADWNAAAPFMAAAVPRALQAAIESSAARHALAVIAVVPHFVAAWNRHARALKRDAWFGVAHGNVLALAACEGGQLRALRHIAIPHGADHYWLTQTAQREALLLGLQAPALIQLSGEVPPALAKPAGHDKHIATAALGAAA
ncbi:hypothetical protein GTP41_23425 [Pseudoduganella sp. DS3]|uniref:Uncharacterized protein n=1 Tax=Pseudoduganella guangdongensis TaxID=2692179 RepID=A0A6N9HQF3_9BURK|nr:hypothetical protein [Pseudoduganella guangdongensis]MYN05052.1 hypothetical protein [Pseudoduganella guangdongensis]